MDCSPQHTALSSQRVTTELTRDLRLWHCELIKVSPKPPCPHQISRLNQMSSPVPMLLKSLLFLLEAQYTAVIGVGFLKENQQSIRKGLKIFSWVNVNTAISLSLAFGPLEASLTVLRSHCYSPWKEMSQNSAASNVFPLDEWRLKGFFLCEYHKHSGTITAWNALIFLVQPQAISRAIGKGVARVDYKGQQHFKDDGVWKFPFSWQKESA